VKIIHCADWHIGRSRNLPGYLERQCAMIDGIYTIAKENAINIVLVAGDVVDRIDLLPKEKDVLIDRIAFYDRKGFRTVFLMGNHDIIEMTINGKYSHIRTVKNLVDRHVLKNTFVIETEPCSFWIDNLFVIAIPNGFGESYATVIKDALESITPPSDVYFTCAMMHEMIDGSINDANFKFTSKLGLDYSITKLVNYVALGDVHRPQEVNRNSWYSGSPIQHDFGDAPPRGVLLVDLTHALSEPELIPIPGIKPLLSVTVNEALSLAEEEAYLRIEHKPGEMVPNVPNLVSSKIVVDERASTDIADKIQTSDIFSGIEDILASEGLSVEEQMEAVNILNKLRASISD